MILGVKCHMYAGRSGVCESLEDKTSSNLDFFVRAAMGFHIPSEHGYISEEFH